MYPHPPIPPTPPGPHSPRVPHVPHVLVHALVVDDELVVRTILATLLRSEGYQVQTADDGRAALALMRASPYPLLVTLDLMLPHGGGLALLEAVAADPALAQRHALVLVTAAIRFATQGRVHDLCTQLHIPPLGKPFDAQQFLDAVTAAEQRRP
jgi:CheY-like chemotaxis protein